jgi:hypothetical protein
MTIDNFCFYFQNRLIQTSQTGGQPYSDTSPFSIPWLGHRELLHSGRPQLKTLAGDKRSSLFFRIVMAKKEKFNRQIRPSDWSHSQHERVGPVRSRRPNFHCAGLSIPGTGIVAFYFFVS